MSRIQRCEVCGSFPIDEDGMATECKCAESEPECPHDEHDHGICLDCGEDITQTLVSHAEDSWEGER